MRQTIVQYDIVCRRHRFAYCICSRSVLCGPFFLFPIIIHTDLS